MGVWECGSVGVWGLTTQIVNLAFSRGLCYIGQCTITDNRPDIPVKWLLARKGHFKNHES